MVQTFSRRDIGGNMNYAIIMTVHNNPKQIRRLCESLINEKANFFIHVDKKSNLFEFENELKDIPRVNIFTEHKVYWADISQVDATISLLKRAVEAKMNYVFFISGQDYLIKKDNNLLKYVEMNKNYMEYEHLPYPKWCGNGRTDRYIYYHNIINNNHLKKFNPRNRYYMFLNRLLVKFQVKLKTNRKFIKNMEPYSGANWFNINYDCAKYIVDNYIKIYKYFKFVQFPDEMFIQTLILNSKFKNTVVNNTLRYVDWFSGPEEPRILTYEDYDKIIKSNNLFCRKVDLKKDEKIFDLIDGYRK